MLCTPVSDQSIAIPSVEQVGGWQFWRFERLESTSKTAKEFLAAGKLALPAIVYAKSQTAGYGRRGRAWQHRPGNLAITYVLKDRPSPIASGAISMMMGLAVLDGLKNLGIDENRLALKWPNDVLLDDKKCAGILVESVSFLAPPDVQQMALVIGIGVNIVGDGLQQQEGGLPIGALADATSRSLSPAIVSAHLTDALTDWWAQWTSGGLSADQLQQLWLSRAWKLGHPVMVLASQASIYRGVFTGVSADGCLRLQLDDGTVQTFSSGEVSVRAEEG
jgi:BirA family biotin operon repressor/biotin-[acetyl-CoA-carboxylase] ligase